jgi:DNA primase
MKLDVEQVLARADLEDLCGADVELRPVAGELHGRCPFCTCTSTERRHVCDRFRINRDRTRWYCRHCADKGGNAIDYAMRRYDLDFLRACVLVGRGAIHLPDTSPTPLHRTAPPSATPFEPLALEPLTSNHAAGRYLLDRRSIPLELAQAAGVGRVIYSGNLWIAFPFLDLDAHVVAYQLRKPSDTAQHLHHTIGPKGDGLFIAGSLATSPIVALTEAPIDALSLAVAGLACIALGGTGHGPAWLDDVLCGQKVLLAHDRDDAGDAGAARHAAPGRLRAVPQAKDWNQDLCTLGPVELRENMRQWCQRFTTRVTCRGPLDSVEQTAAFGSATASSQ